MRVKTLATAVLAGLLGLASSASAANDLLTFHGGSVMHTNATYVIYWAPAGYAFPDGYQTVVDGFLANVAGASGRTDNVYAVNEQYTDATGRAGYGATFGGSYVDANAYPASGCSDGLGDPVCLSDAQIQREVAAITTSRGWPLGTGALIVLMTPANVGVCTPGIGCTFAFCGYHSARTSLVFDTVFVESPYAVVPFPAGPTAGTNCDHGIHPSTPTDDGADAALSILSHEQNESITDPLNDGWYLGPDHATSGQATENGDKCQWTFGTALGTVDGSDQTSYNQAIGTGRYWLQQEWSNASASCVLTSPGRPAAPTSVRATGQGPAASVAFTGTPVPGGGNVSYTVTASPGGARASGSTSPVLVHGLAPGKSYTFTVTAANAYGPSAASTPSTALALRPSAVAPGHLRLALHGAVVTATFSAPANAKAAAVSAYTVVAVSGSHRVAVKTRKLTARLALRPGKWVVTVSAIGASGAGKAASARVTVRS